MRRSSHLFFSRYCLSCACYLVSLVLAPRHSFWYAAVFSLFTGVPFCTCVLLSFPCSKVGLAILFGTLLSSILVLGVPFCTVCIAVFSLFLASPFFITVHAIFRSLILFRHGYCLSCAAMLFLVLFAVLPVLCCYLFLVLGCAILFACCCQHSPCSWRAILHCVLLSSPCSWRAILFGTLHRFSKTVLGAPFCTVQLLTR